MTAIFFSREPPLISLFLDEISTPATVEPPARQKKTFGNFARDHILDEDWSIAVRTQDWPVAKEHSVKNSNSPPDQIHNVRTKKGAHLVGFNS
jgi:hypothetical protein